MSTSPRISGVCEDVTSPSSASVENPLPFSARNIVEQDLPEGGVEAWCTVFGVFLAQFCGYGYTNTFGIYQAFYVQHYLQEESSSAISWIGSLATFLVTLVGPISGTQFDSGYFYHVYTAGAVLQSASIFMLSLVQPGQYYQILLMQGLMSGVGQGLMYIPSFAILSHHFKRRRMTVMSIVSSGSALGGIINPIMMNKLLNGRMGFKLGVQISGAFISVLLFFSCILVRTRYNAVHHETTPVVFWEVTKRCFTELPSLFMIIGFTLFQISFLYPFFYFQVDSLRHGLSASPAFCSLVMINVGSFVARFVAGALLSFVGAIELTIISAIVCTTLIVGTIWLGSVASVVVLGVLYGLFSGLNIAMMAPVLGLMADPTELGLRMGIGFAVTGIGSLIGSPIYDALLTDRYLWWAPALFCAVITLMAGAMFFHVRFSLARAKGEGERAIRGGSGSGGEEMEVVVKA